MNKIPVGRTISQTYGFAIARFLPILGAIWLPFLAIGVVAYFYLLPALASFPAIFQDLAQHKAQNPQAPYLPPGLGSAIGRIFLFELFVLIIFPVMAVGVTKEALGLRRGPRLVYLAIGKRELLVFAGFLTIIALYFVAVVAMVIVGGIAGAAIGVGMAGNSGAHVDPVALSAKVTAVVRPIMLVFYLVILYFFIRLTYFMVPITTAEGRFGVWRGWQMTKGNFWRTFGVILATFLPLTIIEYLIWFAIFGAGMFKMVLNQQLHPELAAAQMGAMMQAVVHYAVYSWLFALVFAPLGYGLMFGQSAFAYRALVPPAPE